jgi:PAS domain S-box-containing protein
MGRKVGTAIACAGDDIDAWLDKVIFLSEATEATSQPFAAGYPDGRMIACNSAFCELTGYTKEELAKARWSDDLTPPDWREHEARKLEEMRLTGKSQRYEKEFVGKDGSRVPVELLVHQALDSHGYVLLYYSFFTDISGRKQADEILLRRESDLSLSQAIAHIGSWRWDEGTGRNEWSGEFYRILGLEPGEVKPTYGVFLSFVHPDDRDRVIKESRDALKEKRASSMDYRIVRRDGTIRHVHVESIGTLADRDGMPVGTFGTLQDVTERKKAEEAFIVAKEQAELYLDLMGHDINNLNQVALGYLEMACDATIDEVSRKYIASALDAIQSSSRLIENVHKLQAAKAGVLKVEPIDLNEVLFELQSEYSQTPDCDVNIHYTIDPEQFVMANGLIKDVFANIIQNAIKHSSSGGVRISIGLKRIVDGGRDYYEVSLEDNGPGIPDDLKKKLFSRFQRGDTKADGKGLGLYLARSLVEDFHGSIGVGDRVHGDHTKGARFVVRLPAV